ncbi:MAG TPA: ABC transporter ATP-binding protein [Thermoanaerobaculia bacterium]|nr:ABC transporter ATP-binding protein [Thermoanaerobaculia bacterium]
MNKPAELRGVTKRFGPTTALDNISLSTQPGELVALLGPNGAGKTTAVRSLLGLTRVDRGEARVFGLDPRHARNRVRTGTMLQVGRVPETLRVSEHIELFSSYYPNPLRLDEVTSIAGLRGLEHRPFGELSGGQKQRLLFALAICGRPDLLILDEPTVGLDTDARRAIWEEIRRFVRNGGTVLLTTHYLQEADTLADRVVVIDHGRILAEGTPSDIKLRVSGKRIRCSTAMNDEDLSALPFVTKVNRQGAATEILASNGEAVLREMFARDRALSNLEVTSAGLEDAIVTLTKEVA